MKRQFKLRNNVTVEEGFNGDMGDMSNGEEYNQYYTIIEYSGMDNKDKVGLKADNAWLCLMNWECTPKRWGMGIRV